MVICDPVIFNVTIVIILEDYELHPCKMINLIDKYVYSDCSMDQPFPSLSAFSGPPDSLNHSNIEIRSINNPAKTP